MPNRQFFEACTSTGGRNRSWFETQSKGAKKVRSGGLMHVRGLWQKGATNTEAAGTLTVVDLAPLAPGFHSFHVLHLAAGSDGMRHTIVGTFAGS